MDWRNGIFSHVAVPRLDTSSALEAHVVGGVGFEKSAEIDSGQYSGPYVPDFRGRRLVRGRIHQRVVNEQ